MDKLDLSLEDISSETRGRGGRGRGGRGGGRGVRPKGFVGWKNPLSRDNDWELPSSTDGDFGPGPVRNARPKSRMNPYARDSRDDSDDGENSRPSGPPRRAGAVKSITTGSNRVLVTNLDSDVIEDDLEEIFEQAGAIKSVTINKDDSGRSLGTAEIVFAKRSVATQIVEDFDGAAVDGRPMFLRLVDTPGSVIRRPREDQERFVSIRTREPPRVERDSGRAGTKAGVFGTHMDQLDSEPSDFSAPRRTHMDQLDSEPSYFARRERGRGRDREGGSFFRGRGRGGRRGPPGGGDGVTAEQLDKDMDSYFNRGKG